jgi:hypothetical protein
MADHKDISVFKRLSSRPYSAADEADSLKRFRASRTNWLEYWLEKHRAKLFDLQQQYPDLDPLSHPQTGRLRAIRRKIELIEQVLDERDAAEAARVADTAAASRAENPAESKHRPGPARDVATAKRVAEIVRRVTHGQPWKGELDDICEALDEEKIPCPKTWKKREIRSWAGATATDRQLAIKAIDHHLENAGLP